MKKSLHLIALAESLGKKYAAVDANTLKAKIQQDIWQDIKNAAAYGESVHGIMNFPQMIQQDGSTLRFDVFRDDGLTGRNIKVYNFQASKPEFASKYAALPEQIQKYLAKNWELFQYKSNGEDVVYKDFILNLTYAPQNQEADRIAGD